MNTNETSTLYTLAARSVQTAVQEKQAKLVAMANKALAVCIRELREMAVDGETPDKPSWQVCQLVAASMVIGDADGYPRVSLTPDVRALVLAAVKAEIISQYIGALEWHLDFSGLVNELVTVRAARDAYFAVKTYREKNVAAANL